MYKHIDYKVHFYAEHNTLKDICNTIISPDNLLSFKYVEDRIPRVPLYFFNLFISNFSYTLNDKHLFINGIFSSNDPFKFFLLIAKDFSSHLEMITHESGKSLIISYLENQNLIQIKNNAHNLVNNEKFRKLCLKHKIHNVYDIFMVGLFTNNKALCCDILKTNTIDESDVLLSFNKLKKHPSDFIAVSSPFWYLNTSKIKNLKSETVFTRFDFFKHEVTNLNKKIIL